jgi:hypothetical protein
MELASYMHGPVQIRGSSPLIHICFGRCQFLWIFFLFHTIDEWPAKSLKALLAAHIHLVIKVNLSCNQTFPPFAYNGEANIVVNGANAIFSQYCTPLKSSSHVLRGFSIARSILRIRNILGSRRCASQQLMASNSSKSYQHLQFPTTPVS